MNVVSGIATFLQQNAVVRGAGLSTKSTILDTALCNSRSPSRRHAQGSMQLCIRRNPNMAAHSIFSHSLYGHAVLIVTVNMAGAEHKFILYKDKRNRYF